MLKKILLGASLLCAATITNAATVTATGEITMSTTNWTDTISVADFDTSLGTLTSVSFTLTGSLEGDAKLESLDAAPATVKVTLEGQIKLFDLDNNLLNVSVPTTNETFNASVFDGGIDFGGTSGIDFGTLTASDTDGPTTLSSLTTSLTLADFTDGVANVFNISAQAQSNASGAGNVITQFGTRAGAMVSIVYTYVPTVVVPPVNVSSPSHIALLGLGLVGLAGVRRLRK